jgi:hypothetical protein
LSANECEVPSANEIRPANVALRTLVIFMLLSHFSVFTRRT